MLHISVHILIVSSTTTRSDLNIALKQ